MPSNLKSDDLNPENRTGFKDSCYVFLGYRIKTCAVFLGHSLLIVFELQSTENMSSISLISGIIREKSSNFSVSKVMKVRKYFSKTRQISRTSVHPWRMTLSDVFLEEVIFGYHRPYKT